jgi:hypothetical protein
MESLPYDNLVTSLLSAVAASAVLLLALALAALLFYVLALLAIGLASCIAAAVLVGLVIAAALGAFDARPPGALPPPAVAHLPPAAGRV